VSIRACRVCLRQKRAESQFLLRSRTEKPRYDRTRSTVVGASIQPPPIKPTSTFHPLLDPSTPLITSGLVLFLVFCNISATEFRRTNHQIIGCVRLGWFLDNIGGWIGAACLNISTQSGMKAEAGSYLL
jgi:hypothetical protein